eukprot:2525959-Prymnesium_polylepis.1
MANSEDNFKRGSIVDSESKVIGAKSSGPMTIGKRGAFRFPKVTNKGIKKFEEDNGILNPTCPYVLLALGRASRQNGLEMHMPPRGALMATS